MPAKKPNLLVILIDDLRYDEFGAGGHPYMKTPNVDRLASEGALFERAFHTTPICSPNRASIMSGQYASRHGIIDNVARDILAQVELAVGSAELITVIYRQFLSSDLTGPQNDPPLTLTVFDISADVFRGGDPRIWRTPAEAPQLAQFGARNGLIVPLSVERKDDAGRVLEARRVGLLLVLNKRFGGQFIPQDIMILSGLARNAAAVLRRGGSCP